MGHPPLPTAVSLRDFGNVGGGGLPIRVSWCRGDEGGKARHRCNCNQEECEMLHKGSSQCVWVLKPAVLKESARQIKYEISWGALGYFFDACRAGRVTAFASDLHLLRSGIAARFAAVFLATFHYAGAGEVGTGVLLRGCHSFCSIHGE